MPYIKQESRDELDEFIENLIDAVIHSDAVNSNEETRDYKNLDGVLNYCIFRLCKGTYAVHNYHWYNRMMGMMECCKQELYRRLVAPYEDEKAKENGDVI